MVYEWSSDLESGHAVIDGQHKALFAAVNRFAEAFQQGKGDDEIEKTLVFLIEYSEQHFHDEEEIQKQYAFPGYARHRRDHLDFKKKVQGFVERYKTEGSSTALLKEIHTAVGDWLLHHIRSDDFVLAAFLREPEAPRLP